MRKGSHNIFSDLLLVLLRDAPLPPLLRGLFDQASGELWLRGGGVILMVEPLRVPPVVGCRELHGRVLTDLIVPKLDVDAPHRHVQLLPTALLPLPLEADGEEIPPQVKVGADPLESFAHRDEHHHVLDLVGIEMLQLNLVEVQQPPEEFVGGGREPTLVEVGKRHHVASGGDDESSSPGSNHSSIEVHMWRRP